MDQVHATIPLEVLEAAAGLCDVGHTWFACVRCANRGVGPSSHTSDAGSAGVAGTRVTPVVSHIRHCERSEAIQSASAEGLWIASSQELLAMTARRELRALTSVSCPGRSAASPAMRSIVRYGALQSRGPCLRILPCRLLGPGSAEQRHSASKTRVNALVALLRVRDTRELKLDRNRRRMGEKRLTRAS